MSEETRNLIPATPITINMIAEDSLSEALNLTTEEWEELNEKRKEILKKYAKPFIESFVQQEERPPFTRLDVMKELQDNQSQQGILMLAAEKVIDLLNEALQEAEKEMEKDPVAQLMTALQEMITKGGDDTPEEEK